MRTVDALPEHVASLFESMGEDRRLRLIKMHGPNINDMIIDNIARSKITWCGLDNYEVVTLGGVYPIEPLGSGYVWQIVTDAVRRHKRAYIEQGKACMSVGLQIFSCLVAPIEAEYGAAIRHAYRMGMTTKNYQVVGGVPVCICMRMHS